MLEHHIHMSTTADLTFSPGTWCKHSMLDHKLTCRHQKVVVNGSSSECTPVLSGVPQVSILGPLLFLIYVNNSASFIVSVGSQLALYADDLVLYRPISTSHDNCVVQNDMAAIEAWSVRNSIPLILQSASTWSHLGENSNGTSFSTTAKCYSSTASWIFSVSWATSGLWFVLVSTYKPSMFKGKQDLLYKRCYNYADSDVLKQLYISLVRPQLEYGCVIWDPYTN